MLLTRIQEVDDQFYKALFGETLSAPIIKTYLGENFSPTIRYYKRSSIDYVEESFDSYPCISVQPFLPTEKNPSWNFSAYSYYGAFRDTDNDIIDDVATRFYNGVPFEFRYEINLCANTYTEYEAMLHYYMQKLKFTKGSSFMFFPEMVGTFLTGLPVHYRYEIDAIPRDDEKHEAQITLYLDVFLHLNFGNVENEEIELLQTLGINIESN